MEKFIVYETANRHYAVRPSEWTCTLNNKGQITEACNHTGLFQQKEEAEKFAEWKNVEAQGNLNIFPFKVGDTVYARASCEFVATRMDRDTGATECPFEDDCEFEDCDNSRIKLFKTTVESIFNNGYGWKFTLKGLYAQVPFSDIDRAVFLTKEEAEKSEEIGITDAMM